MNQHSWPHWAPLTERMLLRLPLDLKEAMEEAATKAGVPQAEWLRLLIARECNITPGADRWWEL